MIRAARAGHPLAGTVDVVVIGAGHAGLAMSRALSERSIDHVVLERGEVANSWRHERWDSLRLLTPNWQSRLPGYRYSGADPHGYMSVPEVVEFIDTYAKVVGAPVRTGTTVTSVCADDDGYCVVTDRGQWQCRAVVIASGAHNVPAVPPIGAALPKCLRTLASKDYRNPAQLDDRGVLVVGASATGLQLADEIQRSGRHVTLSVGEHIRMPRVYRGLDIQWWLDAIGVLDERYDEVDDIVRARRVPSPQLIGTPQRSTLDLNTLAERGVEIVGADRRVGRAKRQERHVEPAPAVCSDTRRRRAAPEPRSGRRAHRHRHLGHRLPAGLRMAARAGARPQRRPAPRRRKSMCRGFTRSGSTSCGGESRASCMAPKTTCAT
jgi:putative flavoprotein involved in K+ transport